jgi:large subunit ribosomal protein L25
MEIIAKKRTIEGKAVKKLRREGVVPGLLFGKGISPVLIETDTNLFSKVYKTTGETSLVDLVIEKEKPIKVLIDEVQNHPVSGIPIHVSFNKVKLTEKITANVPLEIVGEPAIIKSGEGIALHLIQELEVECLPTDLPHKIIADISKLEKIDDAVAIKDLGIDLSKISVKADPGELVVKIDYATQPEQEEEVVISEQELISKVEATKELSEEEKAKREAEKKEGRNKEEKK